MKVKFTAIALILASGLIAGTSFAAVSREQVQAGLTRVQVKAELAEALRTGDFMVVGEEPSAKCNELHPNMHQSV